MKTHLSLNGVWSFRKSSEAETWPATVPGCVHSDLLGNGLIPDPFYGRNEFQLQWIEEEDWEYFRDFDVEKSLLASENLDLVCEELDTVAAIQINGQTVGTSSNMFHPHRFPVKKFLRSGTNTIRVIFTSPMKEIRKLSPTPLKPETCDRVGGRPLLRKEQCSFGWDWGPRLTSSGISESIYLEGWNSNRLDSVRTAQEHSTDRVLLSLFPETSAQQTEGLVFSATLRFEGSVVASTEFSPSASGQLEVKAPKLWWTNGLGGQPLYHLSVRLFSPDGTELDIWERRLGLCEVRLEQKADQWGTSFHFTINGVPVFAKGANWIPCHSFMPERTDERYRDLVQSAADANMNMLRIWGGGSYERDVFYDLCDEKGILIWQDFMFACAFYPGTPAFVDSVRMEAEFQIKRLRHHAGFALWCGNNEAEHLMMDEASSGKSAEDYRAMFYVLLPDLVKQHHPVASYIPTSPFNLNGVGHPTHNEDSGDAHFWDVWHSRKPVEVYEQQYHRFYSEFGMQAYPHPETVATFTRDINLFGPDMDCHQKNGGGNATIFDYVSRLYRFPKDYRGASYLSQFNQAYCMKTGIEHFRRNMPRTMGALYWQLNDIWPAASWSSIDFGGRWKALQFAARRFFSPLLISPKRLGREEMHGSTNTLFSTIQSAEIHAVYDGIKAVDVNYSWTLFHVENGEVLRSGGKKLRLEPNTSTLVEIIDFSDEIEKAGREKIVLQTRLEAEGLSSSENTTLFTPPRKLEFSKQLPDVEINEKDGAFEVRFLSGVFLPHVMVHFENGADFRASDNFFDLFPGQAKVITLKSLPTMNLSDLKKNLRVTSLANHYI